MDDLGQAQKEDIFSHLFPLSKLHEGKNVEVISFTIVIVRRVRLGGVPGPLVHPGHLSPDRGLLCLAGPALDLRVPAGLQADVPLPHHHVHRV